MKRLLQWLVARFATLRESGVPRFLSVLVAAVLGLGTLCGYRTNNVGADIRVPNVVNETYGQAQQELRGLQLNPVPAPPGANPNEDARVIGQIPASGAWASPGDAVRLTVPTATPGDANISVPDLSRMTPASAAVVVQEKGLRFEADVPGSDSRQITWQRPPASTLVPPNTLVVARSEPIPQQQAASVPVPRILNMTPEDAAALVQGAGLNFDPDAPGSTTRRIRKQYPPPSTPVSPGTTVKAWSEPIPPPPAAQVAVPRILDMTPAAAAKLVDDAGLGFHPDVLGSTNRKIIRQSPAPGTLVDVNTEVEAWSEPITPVPRYLVALLLAAAVYVIHRRRRGKKASPKVETRFATSKPDIARRSNIVRLACPPVTLAMRWPPPAARVVGAPPTATFKVSPP
jgi:beta-lactam-binding protein with PASTA domain